MVRIIIFTALISVALMIYTLIECARSGSQEVRSLPKPAWFAVIVFLPLIGAGLWFALGRPQKVANYNPQTSHAPDDDEDFLRQLEVWRRQQQRDSEQKAREEELKQRESKKQGDESAERPANESKDQNKNDGNGAASTEG
ncbi:PLD nuclease N-terminal domain-containing protein [Glutamicibacter sp.]|uniref:PLD nuclease N-terminal domain-containing protein n=1 Tax=Glutamicibacter sp. TaxID=1931995 RepID=UPI0028BD2CA4|nr:PLD nuclease N-terminal domain-containing protein [Glutamicibacter sp.]